MMGKEKEADGGKAEHSEWRTSRRRPIRTVEGKGVRVRQAKPTSSRPPEAAAAEPGNGPSQRPAANGGLTAAGRVPLTTRIRPDLAAALKRLSLERQLEGTTPNSVQDILEEALEAVAGSQRTADSDGAADRSS